VQALIHAAGVLRVGPLGALDRRRSALMWQLHVEAVMRIANLVVPAMAQAGAGRVVLIGSRVARGMAGRSQYAATKAALVALARSWAAETVASGVTVNVVSPAATETAMLADPARTTVPPKLPPLGRLIQPRGDRRAGHFPALARRRGHHRPGDPDLRRRVACGVKAWLQPQTLSALSAWAWSAGAGAAPDGRRFPGHRLRPARRSPGGLHRPGRPRCRLPGRSGQCGFMRGAGRLQHRRRAQAWWKGREACCPSSAFAASSTAPPGHPDELEALAARLDARGITFIEAPLSGSSQQIAAGEATLLLGGEAGALQACEPVLSAISGKRIHVGGAGMGAKAKLATNLVLGLNRAALAEGMVFAESLGIAPEQFLALVLASPATSGAAEAKGRMMVAEDFAPQSRIHQHLKDVKLMIQGAAAEGQQLPLSETHAALMRAAIAAGDGELDNAAIIRELRRRKTAPPFPPT
jgi:3-hydroxyisobutyrate dehydrogenase-like beta-hydroxyacid dehydrogenase/NAD(P)-dependent dehydrogenase (short-subunit alcohol dehydrogenase family)